MDIGSFEGSRPTGKYDPKPTPTIIGPCYAIRKDFYHKIGLLDPGEFKTAQLEFLQIFIAFLNFKKV
jgi:hypothetical protein